MIDPVKARAFRARRQNLGERLAHEQLVAAVATIGMRDSQGSGTLALHARVEGIGGDDLKTAITEERVVEVIGPRGYGMFVPSADVSVFSLGSLPADEESLRTRLKPFLPVLDHSGHTATQALALAQEVTRRALSQGPIGIGELSGALTRALPELSPMCRGRCAVAHIDQGLFDLVGESALWRRERSPDGALYVPIKELTDRAAARAALVRRYLRCHGPSSAAHFANWCGISKADAARSLSQGPTSEIAKGTYMLTEDLHEYESGVSVGGLRLLPPRDPYLFDQDRATLAPDRELQKRVWKPTPTDGVVLVAGEGLASWRPKKAGKRLRLSVQPVRPMPREMLEELRAEAEAVAELRGCTTVEVDIAS